jgi:hypothetical protein
MYVPVLYASPPLVGNWLGAGSWKLEAGSWKLILAVAIDERFERTAQFRREVVFVDRAEQRYGRLIGLELRDAAGACRQVPFQFRVYRRRQMVLHEVRQEAHEIGAAAFFGHVFELGTLVLGFRFSVLGLVFGVIGSQAETYTNRKPNPKT